MSLGEQLRNARMSKKLTASQVAAATRMMVQIVEAIEREDFSKVAAPIYSRGFIKLYAEHVGLDPKPLIDEYMSRFVLPARRSPAERGEVGSDEASRLGVASGEARVAKSDLSDVVPLSGAKSDALRRIQSITGEITTSFVELWKQGRTNLLGKLQAVRDTWQRSKLNLPGISFIESPLRSISVLLGVLLILVFVISGLSRCVRRPKPDIISSAEEIQEKLRIAVEPPAPYFD